MKLARAPRRSYGAKVSTPHRAAWVFGALLVAGLAVGGVAYAANKKGGGSWKRVLSTKRVAGTTYRISETRAGAQSGAGAGPYIMPADDFWAQGMFWNARPADWPADDANTPNRIYYERAAKQTDDFWDDSAADPNGDTRIWAKG